METKNEFKYFPVCIDNFFSNPNLIREFGLSLSKTSDVNSVWPGVRSLPLCEIDKSLNDQIILKILSCYYDLRFVDVSWEASGLLFQVIPSGAKLNEGWIHKDIDYDLAGLIYLTPNANLDSGTSLYNIKPEEEKNYMPFASLSEQRSIDKTINENYLKQLKLNNDKFYLKTKFQNIYNRMIMYDSLEYHGANNYYTGTDDRMTLIFFLKNIKSTRTKYPLQRVKDTAHFDDSIKFRIDYLNENIKSKTITPEETDISDK